MPQMSADGVEHCRRFRRLRLAIETNQFQELFAAEFTTAFAANGLLQTPIEPMENTTNKLVRISRLGPLLSQGKLRFKSHSRGTHTASSTAPRSPSATTTTAPTRLEMATRLAGNWLAASASTMASATGYDYRFKTRKPQRPRGTEKPRTK